MNSYDYILSGAMRGRYTPQGIRQQIEPRFDLCTNTITTVQKDNILIYLKEVSEIDDKKYRVRRLTPSECWKLMGFSENDYDKARQALNIGFYHGRDRSGSQLYKQAGNSIVVDVLIHIFKNLHEAMPYLFEDMRVGSFFSGIGAFEMALKRFDTYSFANEKCDSTSNSLEQIGYINNNADANRIYTSTMSRTLKAEEGCFEAKTGWYLIKEDSNE